MHITIFDSIEPLTGEPRNIAIIERQVMHALSAFSRKADTVHIERKKPHLEDWEWSSFMCLPTDRERRECHTIFFNATGSAVLAQGVCSVCARECGTMDKSLSTWRLSQDSHSRLGAPSSPPAQTTVRPSSPAREHSPPSSRTPPPSSSPVPPRPAPRLVVP
ncbi:hypothetical protein M405DRAFT_62073 [Rhizopogon salebrosus TDB-379]|nr:hypothetical protein M405DRAFT_62073 [Rhizopogon salebrosus TDB-379]